MSSAASQTIVFIGDSITHAHRRPEEVHDCYRFGCGYVNLIAGELKALDPARDHRFINSGECGDTTRHLLARWERDCLSHQPNLVSILIGINDAHSPGLRTETFHSSYRTLLNRTREQLPATAFLLMEPFGVRVTPDPSIETISENQLARLGELQPIVRDLAAESGAVFVPLQNIFDQAPATAWTLDGIHPSAAGHWQIAQAWLAATRAAGWFPPRTQESDDR